MKILQRLRVATAGAHARTEGALPSLEELATKPSYRRMLELMYGFHVAWEPAIWDTSGVDGVGLVRDERAKLPLLERDLVWLGGIPTTIAIRAPDPMLPATAHALGAMYVLEGATLGGQVIERHVATTLGVSPSLGGSYFHGYGSRTGDMWRAFGVHLDDWVDAHGQESCVEAGAIECFDALGDWIETIGSLGSPLITAVTR